MTLPSSKQNQAGFTLVELAIVLMIIGLLVGGVLRGQELMENARVAATIQQTKSYTTATTTFRDSYQGFPGDIVNASTGIPNCSTNATCAVAGDGNGILGTNLANTGAATYATAPASENTRYWLQLGLTGLVTGIDTNVAASTTQSWASRFPSAKVTGGFQIASFSTSGTPTINGMFLILRTSAGSGDAAIAVQEAAGASAVPAQRAAQIDTKIDDGLPRTGDVIGVSTNATCTGTTYNLSTNASDCNVLIRLQG